MPTVQELRSKHPEFEWTAVNGPKANDWYYVGKRGDEHIRVVKFEEGWFVDRNVHYGAFVITGRPEEYRDWSREQVYRREHPEQYDDEDDEEETPDGR
jgi:hypothetical protein